MRAGHSGGVLGVVVSLLAACSDPPGTSARPQLDAHEPPNDTGDAPTDTGDAPNDASGEIADVEPDDVAPPPDSLSPDTDVPDAGAECPAGWACAALLAEGGTCPRACFPQPDRLTCAGTVVEHLCLPPGVTAVAAVDAQAVDLGALRVTVTQPIPRSTVGEVHTLAVTITNTSAAHYDGAFGTNWKPNWRLVDASFMDLVALSLDAGQSIALTATFEALRPDALDLDGGRLITLYLGDLVVDLHAGIRFSASNLTLEMAVLCGDQVYPSTWCGDETCTPAASFSSARCCDGVFFPGAACCSDAECEGGACVDGACVTSVPRLAAANTLAHGTQRVLVVLADYPELPGDDPCLDRHDELADALQLDAVEAWFAERATERTGAPLLDLRWTVLSGLNTDALVPPGNDRWLVPYRDALALWLETHADAGCPRLDTFDKVVVAAAKADLHGHGGVYLSDGLVGVGSYQSHRLTAHELTHSFGATDLGLGLEGRFLYPDALMGATSATDPTDQVAWGELGWGDVDRDGVIDVFEYAAAPDSVAVSDLTAEVVPAVDLASPSQLRVRWRFTGTEGGVTKRVFLPRFRFTLPDLGVWMDASDAHDEKDVVVPLGGAAVDAIVSAQSVRVQLDATLRFTDSDGVSQTLPVSVTQTVTLVVPE